MNHRGTETPRRQKNITLLLPSRCLCASVVHSVSDLPMSARRVALVTGSGKRRVGWHVADALAQRGYALALHYRSSVTEATVAAEAFRQRGVEVLAVQADLADEVAVRLLVEMTLKQFGRIDVLVN